MKIFLYVDNMPGLGDDPMLMSYPSSDDFRAFLRREDAVAFIKKQAESRTSDPQKVDSLFAYYMESRLVELEVE